MQPIFDISNTKSGLLNKICSATGGTSQKVAVLPFFSLLVAVTVGVLILYKDPSLKMSLHPTLLGYYINYGYIQN